MPFTKVVPVSVFALLKDVGDSELQKYQGTVSVPVLFCSPPPHSFHTYSTILMQFLSSDLLALYTIDLI